MSDLAIVTMLAAALAAADPVPAAKGGASDSVRVVEKLRPPPRRPAAGVPT